MIGGVVASFFLPWSMHFGVFISLYSFLFPVFSYFFRKTEGPREAKTVREMVEKTAKGVQVYSLVCFIGGVLFLGFFLFTWNTMYPTSLERHLFTHYPRWLLFLCCGGIGMGLMILPARVFTHLFFTQLFPLYVYSGTTNMYSFKNALIALIPIAPLFFFAQPISTAFLVLLSFLKGFNTADYSGRGTLYTGPPPVSVSFTVWALAIGFFCLSLYVFVHPYQKVKKLLSQKHRKEEDLS